MYFVIVFAAFLIAALASVGAVLWDPFPGDRPIALLIQTIHLPGLQSFMEGVSYLGSASNMVVYATLAGICLWTARLRKECYAIGLTLLFTGLNPLMKLAVDRPRPSPDLLLRRTEDFGGLGFPSGHAFQAALLFGLLVYLASVYVRVPWLRRSLQLGLIALIGAIGMSRVYLGAHWPSDVVGGYLTAMPLVALVLLYHRRATVAGSA
jgi:undecaprenyl-diphosphatase